MKMERSLRHQQGLSLTELMVAVTIGLILTMGMIQVFSGNRQGYRMQEALSRLQENGRFAVMFMEKDIRMADYRGCGTRSANIPLRNTLNSATSYLWDLSRGIEGYEAVSDSTWDRTLDASINILSNPPLGGTDILTVRRAIGEVYKVVTHVSGTDDVVINNGANIDEGDVVILADCQSAAAFQVTAEAVGALAHDVSGGTPGNSTNNLGRGYASGDVFRYETISYYIRTGTSGRPALHRRVANANAQELIQGVEDLQLLYGEDTDGDDVVDAYVAADGVADWSDVISVSINLLLATEDDNLTPRGEAQAFVFNGNTLVPNDNRLRRAFSSTVTLRNRTL